MRRKAVDKNQAEIVKAFRKLGFSVLDLHAVGKGCPDLLCCPDLLVGFQAGREKGSFLVEVKDGSLSPSRRKLTPQQIRFHKNWSGRIEIVESVDDVETLASLYGKP